MKTIERYVFGAFLSSFFLAFLVLSFVLTIGLMVQIVSYILQGLSMPLVGRFALVSFPETLQWTIPLGLLVASILVFSRLSADSEIAAMRACGVNLLSVIRWPMIFAIGCTGIGLFINNEIVPRGHEVRRNLAKKISVGSGLELLEPGKVIDDFPDMKVYFDHKEGNWLYDLTVIDYSNPKINRMVTASKALVTSEGRDILLDLHDMTVDPMDEAHPGMARATRFQYRVKDALKDSTYRRKEKDFRFFEMIACIRQARWSLDHPEEVIAGWRAAGQSGDKANEIKMLRKSQKRYLSDVKTEFMKRWVFAFASVCFVLVGVPLGIRAQRRESTIGMAIALATSLCYYMGVILMTSLSKNAAVHPEILIWLPVALCLALAAYLIPKNL